MGAGQGEKLLGAQAVTAVVHEGDFPHLLDHIRCRGLKQGLILLGNERDEIRAEVFVADAPGHGAADHGRPDLPVGKRLAVVASQRGEQVGSRGLHPVRKQEILRAL